MGLIGGIARTAVVAGTATAVSNNVSRRQAARWSRHGRTQPGYLAPTQPAYERAPEPYQQAPVPPAAPAGDDLTAKLDRLTAMKERGQLTEDEFVAAKAKLLGL